ncbi:MAG: hypothetical protein KJ002_03070 [Candidatus Dadabacteria bacterium]|nr:hypothetical protein [Candidatus Dadabacteria bacterium]
MEGLKKGYGKLRFHFLFLLSSAHGFLNLFLNHKLGAEGPAYVDEFAGGLGYELGYDDASFDPLFRLRIRGAAMSSPDGGKPYVEIGSVIVNPSIISSILGRKVRIGDVYVERPVVRYDAEAADRLINLFKGDEDGKGRGGGVSVEVERVRIRDAAFEVSPGFTLTSESMNVLIIKRSGDGDYDEINASGDVKVKGVVTEIAGSVNLRQGAADGKLVITADRLSGIPLPDEVRAGPTDVSARADIEFRAAATVESSGTVTLSGYGQEDAPRLAELIYVLDFDRAADAVSFEKLGFDVLGVLTGNFSGEIRDATGDAVFDLSGSSGEGDISNIVKRLPWLDAGKISGTAKAEDLKVTGSLKKGDFNLTGKLLVDNAGFEYGDGMLDIRGLDCALDISQSLQPPFTQDSTGKCTAGTVASNAAGEVKDVSTSVRTAARESFGSMEVKLADLNANYLGGGISGAAGLDVSDGKSRLSGKINGRDLDVSRIPEDLIPFDVAGRAESLSADFKGEGGEYAAEVSFAVNGLEINLGEGRDFKLSRAATSAPVRIEYAAGLAEAEDGAGGPYGKITVRDEELAYEKLSFADYFIESGRMEDLGFTIDLGGDWALRMTSRGSGFRVLGMDVALGKFRERLVIDKSGREGFSGSIEGSGGLFNGIELPSVSAAYEYGSDSIDIRDVKAEIGAIGVFNAEKAGVVFGKDKGYLYEITFSGGVFSSLSDRIRSERMTGRFTILDSSKNERGWEGVINSPTTTVTSETIENLAMNIAPLPEGVSVSGISGRLRGGDLGGKVDILTSGERTELSANMALNNPVIRTGSREIAMRWARINYSGLLTPGSLPEGSGKIDISGLAVPDGAGGKVLLQAGVDAATSGETLLVKEGFIRDSEGTSVRVEGEMENILSGPVKTDISMQDVSLKSLSRLLAPFMPPSVSEAKLDGSAAMSAEFVNLFGPDMSWNGEVTFKNASYAGYTGGALLSVRGVNGALTIKESGTAENPLAAFLDTGLELDRDVYRKYHKSLRDTPVGDTLDHLRIGEIEYGILKFHNVQCELEADNDKLTIVRLVSDFFGGKLYGTGLFDYGGESAYNFSFLFNDISLEGISRRLSPLQEYITGRVNGLVWLAGKGGDTGTVNGPFELWSVSSPKEQRTIGKALLDQLGAKERLILGSNRSYDTGEISGYINDGVITFKKFEISNSILGIKNLSIQADPIRNSISISHLVSVIREIARRSQSGGPTIETN